MANNTAPFTTLFNFQRPAAAPYRDATGQMVAAAGGVPRFDHTPQGVPRGLLIEGRPERVVIDRVVMNAPIPGQAATVLHAIELPGGVVRRTAYFTERPQSVVEACLSFKGHHRSIGVFAGYLPRRTSSPTQPVHFDGQAWEMAGVLTFGAQSALADPSGRILIEG